MAAIEKKTVGEVITALARQALSLGARRPRLEMVCHGSKYTKAYAE